MKLTTIAFLIWIGLSVGSRCGASTDVLTFEDIGISTNVTTTLIPDGYGSLVWENFYVLDQRDSRMSIVGYSNAFVSGMQIAANYAGVSIGDPRIWSSGSFDFVSGYFTAANNDGQQLEAMGFSGSTLLYDNTYTLDTAGPTLVNFGYAGITEIRFIASGGTPQSPLVYGERLFAMDNLTINQVPEPTSSLLLLAGGITVGVFSLQNRKAARGLE